MRRRLLGLIIGAVIGAIGGMVIAIYLDKWNWNPPNGWQPRFLIALTVGGVGAILGALFGPPQAL
jgi:branched-subunit amino acid ABC-type transport system permease component